MRKDNVWVGRPTEPISARKVARGVQVYRELAIDLLQTKPRCAVTDPRSPTNLRGMWCGVRAVVRAVIAWRNLRVTCV